MLINFNTISIPKINYSGRINRVYPNLQHLSKDTVSFSAGRKLEGEAMRNAPSISDCKQVRVNAEPALYYLQTVLDKYIGPLSDKKVGSDKYESVKYVSKRKSETSIREKVVSKYSKNAEENDEKFSRFVSEELSKNLPLKPHVKKNAVYSAIKRHLSIFQLNDKIPPHPNAHTILEEFKYNLEGYNLFDLSIVDRTYLDNLFDEIENSLEAFSPNIEHNDGTAYINPIHVAGIKHYANDICQSRIILLRPEKKYTNDIIKSLQQAVEDGVLTITSIENNIPDEDRIPEGKKLSDYEYIEGYKLRKFAKEIDVPYIRNVSKSGYLGIHVNVDLSNSDFSRAYNNYSGEIQIIGQDVMKLKDIEDLCYKIKDNKNIANRGYGTFQDYFLTYYTPETKEAFDEYTYALYLAQRALPSGMSLSAKFPSIKELGFEGKVPQELDYNNLRIIKDSCDISIKRQRELDKNSANKSILTKKQKITQARKQDEIDMMKDFVDIRVK